MKHLSNDKTDPFTRAPLKIDDLVELVDLEAAINKYRKEKLDLL